MTKTIELLTQSVKDLKEQLARREVLNKADRESIITLEEAIVVLKDDWQKLHGGKEIN